MTNTFSTYAACSHEESFIGKAIKKIIALHRWLKIGVMVVGDGVALPLCFMIALLLRRGSWDLALDYGFMPHIAMTIITILAFAHAGLYRAVIRYIDIKLLASAGIALAVVVFAAFCGSFMLNYEKLPHTAVMIYWFIAFSYVVSSRLTIRALLRSKITPSTGPKKTCVAIYGAGEAGAKLAAAMRNSDEYRALCFFDDKHTLANTNVAGLRVYHTNLLSQHVHKLKIHLIILAIPSATPERRKEVIQTVHNAGIHIKILQNLVELADEGISTKSLREVKLEDLLGRNPVPPQRNLFAKCVQEKNVLVTGAGGSIGSELCRQILSLSPHTLHLIDHSEYALYTIKQELRLNFPTLAIHAHLGSVCDAKFVERVMSQASIHTIYHAAAYKHVPLVEANMAEGIYNNVIGSKVIAEAAEKFRVQTCLLISTDKAVRPTNIMGASKRIAELIFQAAAIHPSSQTTFCMVRFGNVLGSSGSVVPLFRKQIAAGGPITITHPEVVRYFMLIPEAVQLVIQAGAMAQKGGEVFVLDMGQPVKIIDLARTMIDMSGLEEKSELNPEGDIEIRCIGLRPGEKLYEELLIGHSASPSTHPRILYATEYSFPPLILTDLLANLMEACRTQNTSIIRNAIQDIVHEYVPPKEVATRSENQTSDTNKTAATLPKANVQEKRHQEISAFAKASAIS
ncbi:MAG: nucleoside-diphosphate sugar epimerase/dehydratase [Pseudomonadota bacterium]